MWGYVHESVSECLKKPKEGIRYSKAGVTNGCETLDVHAWDEVDPLKG